MFQTTNQWYISQLSDIWLLDSPVLVKSHSLMDTSYSYKAPTSQHYGLDHHGPMKPLACTSQFGRLCGRKKSQCRGKGGRNVGFRRCAVTLPGAGGAATLRRSGGRVALRRCDAATLPGAGDAVTLRRCDAGATLRRCWCCDAGAALRRCWRCDAATRDPRCDAVGAATLRRWSDAATLLALRRCNAGATLRRCWCCDASFCKSAHGVASRRDTLDVYSTWCNALHQGLQWLNDVSLFSCQLGMHVVIASFWMRNAWAVGLSLREVSVSLGFQWARAI